MVAFGHVAEIYVVDVCEGVAHQLFLFFFFFLGILRDQGRSFLEFALRSWHPWGQVRREPAAR